LSQTQAIVSLANHDIGAALNNQIYTAENFSKDKKDFSDS